MKKSSNSLRVGIAVGVILGTIAWLAYSGYGSSKSYYVTIAELGGMGDKAYKSNLRVEGFVKPGSIEQNGTHVTFVMEEFESHNVKAATRHSLRIEYNVSEPPPDTFKDNAQALAAGTFGRDGVFHASELQAKCASKYAPAQPGASPAKPVAAPVNPRAATASATPKTSSDHPAAAE